MHYPQALTKILTPAPIYITFPGNPALGGQANSCSGTQGSHTAPSILSRFQPGVSEPGRSLRAY